jgi:hypothetical protein
MNQSERGITGLPWGTEAERKNLIPTISEQTLLLNKIKGKVILGLT